MCPGVPTPPPSPKGNEVFKPRDLCFPQAQLLKKFSELLSQLWLLVAFHFRPRPAKSSDDRVFRNVEHRCSFCNCVSLDVAKNECFPIHPA